MTRLTRIIDPHVARDAQARGEYDPVPLPRSRSSRRRTPRRASVACNLTLWAGAALGLYLLAGVIAAHVGSWLIGLVGAGLAALLAMALLTSVTSNKSVRRS